MATNSLAGSPSWDVPGSAYVGIRTLSRRPVLNPCTLDE
jgi:hypothetical protein